MFGGSINIPDYDEPLQLAGGENNAYTTNDLTNYYCQLPAENLETAFWLESDRMLSLAFSEKSLDVQRKVVSEEFKEHYLNKPCGDVCHKMLSDILSVIGMLQEPSACRASIGHRFLCGKCLRSDNK